MFCLLVGARANISVRGINVSSNFKSDKSIEGGSGGA